MWMGHKLIETQKQPVASDFRDIFKVEGPDKRNNLLAKSGSFFCF